MAHEVSKVKGKVDKPHWTGESNLCENRGMSQEQQRTGRSVGSWLGLGVLVLLAVGLVRLSAVNHPATESAEPSPSPFTALEPTLPSPTLPASPVPTELSSPLPASFASPLPAGLNSPLPSPSPLPPTPPSPAEVDGFQLTVLHSNDTWGYLVPCG